MRHASQKTNITKVALKVTLKVRLAVIALLAILLFPHLLLQQVAADSNSDHSLRFMTYNVRNSQQGDQGLRDWQLRRDHLVRKILANRPDILALQE